jgi:hypothetical protein
MESKNKIERDLKKLKKKQQQAVATLCRGENLTYDQLTTETATGRMLVTHFGNGDETDQTLVLNYCRKFGSVSSLTVLPGTNYAHVEFAEAAASLELANSIKSEAKQQNVIQIGDRYLVFFHTTITKDNLKRHELFNFPNASAAKSGMIPGLYIFNDFITQDEEQSIVTALDHNEVKWQKLLNRRV